LTLNSILCRLDSILVLIFLTKALKLKTLMDYAQKWKFCWFLSLIMQFSVWISRLMDCLWIVNRIFRFEVNMTKNVSKFTTYGLTRYGRSNFFFGNRSLKTPRHLTNVPNIHQNVQNFKIGTFLRNCARPYKPIKP
jgi:hypothetical protein